MEAITSSGKGMGVYLYLVDGMLIDTGPAVLQDELIPFYNQYDFDFVTLTHSHEDHSGTAAWIQKNKKIPIYIHPKGISVCSKRGNYPKYRQIQWGIRDAFNASKLDDKIHSRNIDWEVIYTPGHADDHVSLYDQNSGRLFSGDMYITPTINVLMKTESISLMIKSIQKLLKLDFETMFCSHAGFIPDGKDKLMTKLENLNRLYESVSTLYKKGYSVSEIDKTLFKKKYRIIEFSEGEYDTIHIVTSIVNDLKEEISIKEI